MTEAFIIDACRTPRGIGKIGKGALADIHPQQLGSTVLQALAERNELNTAEVDDVIWGTSASAAGRPAILGGWPRSMLATTSGQRHDAGPLLRLGDHCRQSGRRLASCPGWRTW